MPNLFAVHAYELHCCKRVRGAKTPAKYSRQKQHDDEDMTEWNGYDANGTEAESYRHQDIGIKSVEKDIYQYLALTEGSSFQLPDSDQCLRAA